MVAGITSSLTVPAILARIPALQEFAAPAPLNLDVSLGFFLIFAISVIGCVAGTLLTRPRRGRS